MPAYKQSGLDSLGPLQPKATRAIDEWRTGASKTEEQMLLSALKQYSARGQQPYGAMPQSARLWKMSRFERVPARVPTSGL